MDRYFEKFLIKPLDLRQNEKYIQKSQEILTNLGTEKYLLIFIFSLPLYSRVTGDPRILNSIIEY